MVTLSCLTNLNAFTPKNFSVAKLSGLGLESCKNRAVSGWRDRNSGTASAALLLVAALRNSRNSAPVRVGKYFVEWAIISVCCRLPFCSGRWNRIAIPRGLALASVSGILGKPVEEEKRTVIGVDAALKCGAEVSSAAEVVGLKVPVSRWPFAWAEFGSRC